MSHDHRSDWSRRIDQIIRSKHYTWIGEQLGGEPLEQALVDMTTDIRHMCKRQNISWEEILERSRIQFEREEAEAAGGSQ